MPQTRETHLGDNLRRLLGMHALSATRASSLLGISSQALSEIQKGKRTQPNIDTMEQLSTFFEVPMMELRHAQFSDLLASHLADRERFERVEARIQEATTA